jgi:hypothetical protein
VVDARIFAADAHIIMLDARIAGDTCLLVIGARVVLLSAPVVVFGARFVL